MGFHLAPYEAVVKVVEADGYAVFELVDFISDTVNEKQYGGLVMDVATALNALNAKVRNLNARTIAGGTAAVNIIMEVRDLNALNQIIGRLRSIRGVQEIRRGS